MLDGGADAGAIAEVGGRPIGLITWATTEQGHEGGGAGPQAAEVRAVAVDAHARARGVGRALLAAAEDALRTAGVRRAWLVTTNDNLAALALYQKAGWRLVTLRPGALDEARRALKPALPEMGQHGIPLRDEIELEKEL